MNTDSITTSQKMCPGCKQLKPLTDFHRNKARPDGHHSQCKVCRSTAKPAPPKPEGMKQCPKCEKWFPSTPEYFHRNHIQKSGLSPRCKSCSSRATKPKDVVPDGCKRCPKCKNVYPATTQYFPLRTDRLSGIRAECIECSRMRGRHYAAQHREQQREKAQRYRQANPEKTREGWKRYRRTHYQQRMAYKRRYRILHRDEILAYAKWYAFTHPEQAPNWRKNNLLKMRVYSQRYRAQKRSIAGTHTPAQIQEQLKRQKYRCYYAACGYAKFEKRDGKYVFHIEHTYPVSRAIGTSIPANDMSYLVLACPTCNHKKRDRLPHEWPEGGRLL